MQTTVGFDCQESRIERERCDPPVDGHSRCIQRFLCWNFLSAGKTLCKRGIRSEDPVLLSSLTRERTATDRRTGFTGLSLSWFFDRRLLTLRIHIERPPCGSASRCRRYRRSRAADNRHAVIHTQTPGPEKTDEPGLVCVRVSGYQRGMDGGKEKAGICCPSLLCLTDVPSSVTRLSLVPHTQTHEQQRDTDTGTRE